MWNRQQKTFGFCAVLLFCIALSAGCTDKSALEDNWQDYLIRLSRVLDRDAASPPPEPALHFPRPRDLASTFATSDIDLLDFLRMRRCALRETIAERNSILGKHGDASAKLIFDLRFLSEAENCIRILKEGNNETLALQLEEAVKLKIRELPARIFSASLAGAEFRELWHAPPDLKGYPTTEQDTSIAALSRWKEWQRQWLYGNWHHDSNAILETLGEIRLGHGGALLKAQQVNTRGLQEATEIIAQRVLERPLCLRPSPIAAAEQFRNVLSSRFIAQIQKQASLVNQHQFALLNQIDVIESELFDAMTRQSLVIPAAYLNWVAQRKSVLDKAKQAHRQHVEVAGELLAQCGLSPGGNGD